MENLGYIMTAFVFGWFVGFATFGYLVWYTVNKGAKLQPALVKRNNVSDLYPPKDNN